MRKKFFTLLFLIFLVVAVIFYFTTVYKENSYYRNFSYKRVNSYDISFLEPYGVKGIKKWKDNRNRWENQYFKIPKIGTVQVSIKYFEKKYNFYTLVSSFLRVKVNENLDYETSPNKKVFYRPLRVPEGGVLALRKKENGQLNYIVSFMYKGRIYWFAFYTADIDIFRAALFKKILNSIEIKGDNKLTKELRHEIKKAFRFICFYSGFRFCINITGAVFIFLILLMLFIVAIVSITENRAGKLPAMETIFNLNPIFKEEDVFFSVKSASFYKMFSGAILITDREIRIYRFRREFIIVPYLEDSSVSIERGKDFFWGEHLKIELKNHEYLKLKVKNPFYLAFLKKFIVKIYFDNPEKYFIYLENSRRS